MRPRGSGAAASNVSRRVSGSRRGAKRLLNIQDCGVSCDGLGRVRWVVERTFAWLHHFKRLLVRYDRHHGLSRARRSGGKLPGRGSDVAGSAVSGVRPLQPRVALGSAAAGLRRIEPSAAATAKKAPAFLGGQSEIASDGSLVTGPVPTRTSNNCAHTQVTLPAEYEAEATA